MRSLLVLLALLPCIYCAGQTRIGLSLNAGDRQHFDPGSPGFARALAPSGSVFINHQEEMKDQWIAQYGLAAGLMGYHVKVVSIDTLSPPGDISPFTEYTTFFGSVDLLLGRKFLIAKRTFMLGAGGGATVYVSTAPYSGYGVHVSSPDDNTFFTVFDAEMTAPANRYSFFWKVALNTDITARFVAGVEYVHHHKPAAQGEYHFYHAETPQSGSIAVYQREFRLELSYKIGRRGNASQS